MTCRLCSWQPPFVHVDVVGDGLDVMSIGESSIGFTLGEDGGDVVVEAERGDVVIPDELVGVVERAALLLAPVENLFIAAALESACLQGIVVDVEEADEGSVAAFAEIGVQVLPQQSLGMKADFAEHAGEVLQPRGFYEGAARQGGWIGLCGHRRSERGAFLASGDAARLWDAQQDDDGDSGEAASKCSDTLERCSATVKEAAKQRGE